MYHFIDKVEKIEVDDAQIDQYLQDIYKKLEWMDRETLTKHFVSMAFNRFLSYYKNAPDLNVIKGDKGDRGERSDRRSQQYSRFFINKGAKDKLSAARLMGLINEQTRGNKLHIGKIDIMKTFSFFEVEKSAEMEILDSFSNAVFEGVKVIVELSKPDSKRNQGSSERRHGSNERRSGSGERSRRSSDRSYGASDRSRKKPHRGKRKF